MVTLGWQAGPEQDAPDELLGYAVAAARAGCSWTWPGAAAARTRTIQLGTGGTCPLLRYHPAIVSRTGYDEAMLRRAIEPAE